MHPRHWIQSLLRCILAGSIARGHICREVYWALVPTIPFTGVLTADAPFIIVTSFGAEFCMSHLCQFVIKIAVSITRDDALQELRGRYAGCSSRWDEFT